MREREREENKRKEKRERERLVLSLILRRKSFENVVTADFDDRLETPTNDRPLPESRGLPTAKALKNDSQNAVLDAQAPKARRRFPRLNDSSISYSLTPFSTSLRIFTNSNAKKINFKKEKNLKLETFSYVFMIKIFMIVRHYQL